MPRFTLHHKQSKMLAEKYEKAAAKKLDGYLPQTPFMSNLLALDVATMTYGFIADYLHATIHSEGIEPSLDNVRLHIEDWFESFHTIKDGSTQILDELGITNGMDGHRFRFAVNSFQHLDPGETYYEIEIASDNERWTDGRLDWSIALFQCNHTLDSDRGWDYDHLIICDSLDLAAPKLKNPRTDITTDPHD